MRLTTKGRYAVTAMLDLALHGVDHPVSLADISGRQDISLSYLEQLFAKLRRNNLVSSVIAVLSVLFLREAVGWDGQRDLLHFGGALALIIIALTIYLVAKGRSD